MPTAEIDYHKAALLRANGLSFPQIAKQLNVNAASLRVGFSKKGLTKVLAETRQMPTAPSGNGVDLSKSSNNVRSRLAKHLEHVAYGLDSARPAKSLKTVAAQAKAVNDLVANSVKVFGWDQDNDQKLVSVLVLSGYDPHDPPPVKAIDVQSLPAGSPSVPVPEPKPMEPSQGEG